MIKNVVLDMGKVLLSFDPYMILNKVCENEAEKKLIFQNLFESEEWIMGDRGEITNEQRYDLVKKRIPESMHEKLKECVMHWDIFMEPIAGAKEFISQCKEQGMKVYVLSNACNKFFEYFPKHYNMDVFDGIMVSSKVRLIKPDVRIYELLCNTYGLTPQECLFIDDKLENVEAARKVGLHAFLFEGDYELVKRELEQIEG